MTTIRTRPCPDDGAASAAGDRALHGESAFGGARPDTSQPTNPAPWPASAAEQVRAGLVLS